MEDVRHFSFLRSITYRLVLNQNQICSLDPPRDLAVDPLLPEDPKSTKVWVFLSPLPLDARHSGIYDAKWTDELLVMASPR